MIKEITSKENPRIKYALKLKEKKYRQEYQQFLGESLKSLELAIKANLVNEVFTLSYLDIPENIVQYIVTKELIKKLAASSNPEGVVFIANIPEYKKDNLNKILYLEEINDPGNLGTLVRTALAFNFDAVITSSNSVSIYNEKALAAAKGANYLIPVFSSDLSSIKNGHVVIATSLDIDSRPIDELGHYDKFILLLGNEAHGLSKEIILEADIKVKIDINNIDSLNVGIAGGILMHHLSK